jgi:hypothetical protein
MEQSRRCVLANGVWANFWRPRQAPPAPEFIPMYSRLTGNSSSSCVASSPCGVCIVARCAFLAAKLWARLLFVSKWMVRSVVGGLVIAIIVGVVWQTYRDNQARKLIKAWGHSSVIWLSSSFGATQHDSELLAQSSTKLSDEAAPTPAAASMQANEVAEFKQKLMALANDLAVMRRDVEQFSSKHEQLSRDVATVQATLQNVSEKISPLALPAPTHGPPRKSVPRLVRAETPRQSAAAPVPPETPRQPDAASAAPTTSPAGLTEQPPRPPLPVPTAAETPPPPR